MFARSTSTDDRSRYPGHRVMRSWANCTPPMANSRSLKFILGTLSGSEVCLHFSVTIGFALQVSIKWHTYLFQVSGPSVVALITALSRDTRRFHAGLWHRRQMIDICANTTSAPLVYKPNPNQSPVAFDLTDLFWGANEWRPTDWLKSISRRIYLREQYP